MPQFTLKQLFVVFVPIAIGIGLIAHAVCSPGSLDPINAIAHWLCGGTLIGGGFGGLFRHALAGALVGTAIQLFTLFLVGERLISFC